METRFGEIAEKEQDFESFSNSIAKSIIEKLKEIVAKDKQLSLKEEILERNKKQYEERLRELELYAVEIEEDRDKISDQLRELELRDVQFRELEEFRRKCEADGKKLKERMHILDCKEKQFEGRVQEFDLRSMKLEREIKELESNKNKIIEAWNKLDEALHGVDQIEKQVDGRAKKPDLLSKGLARRHQVLERNKRYIETDSKDVRICELHSREKQLDLRSKDLERQHKEFELDKRKIEADWKILDKRILEVDCKERGLNKGLIDLKSEQKELESNQRKLEAHWKKLEEQFCEVSCRERQLDSGLKSLEFGKKDLCRQHKELESDKIKFVADRKKLDEQLLEVDLKSKKTEETMEELESKRKDLEEKFRNLESDRRKFKVDREKLDDLITSLSIEKQKAHLTEEALSGDNGVDQCSSVNVPSIEITSKACQMVEKSPMLIVAGPNTPQLKQTSADLPEIGDVTSDVQSLDSDSQHQPVPVISTQDPLPKKRKLSDGKSISTKIAYSSCKPEEVGKDLLGVVLRQNLDFTKVRDKVVEILQSTSNPATTVLNIMKLCRPTKSIKEEVPISWCISLLKELKGVSYTIGHSTIEEARVFSMSWKETMKEKKGDHMEIACFLLFVDAYQLGITRAIILMIESVHCPRQLRDFFEQIGMPDFLPDSIKSLVRMNNRILAVRYIEALNLRDKFPIVPILNAHLAYSNQFTDEKYDKESYMSDCPKMSAISRRLDAVESVIEVVKQCNLEVVYPLRPLQDKLDELIRLQNSEGEHQQLINREEEASDTATAITTVTTKTASSSKVKPAPSPLHSSSVSSSCGSLKRAHQGVEQSFNRINYASPAPMPLVRPPQPYPWFGGFHHPPPPHPNQFGLQIGPGGWSNFPSCPPRGFV